MDGSYPRTATRTGLANARAIGLSAAHHRTGPQHGGSDLGAPPYELAEEAFRAYLVLAVLEPLQRAQRRLLGQQRGVVGVRTVNG